MGNLPSCTTYRGVSLNAQHEEHHYCHEVCVLAQIGWTRVACSLQLVEQGKSDKYLYHPLHSQGQWNSLEILEKFIDSVKMDILCHVCHNVESTLFAIMRLLTCNSGHTYVYPFLKRFKKIKYWLYLSTIE